MADSLSNPSSIFWVLANTRQVLNATLTTQSPRDPWKLAKLWVQLGIKLCFTKCLYIAIMRKPEIRKPHEKIV